MTDENTDASEDFLIASGLDDLRQSGLNGVRQWRENIASEQPASPSQQDSTTADPQIAEQLADLREWQAGIGADDSKPAVAPTPPPPPLGEQLCVLLHLDANKALIIEDPAQRRGIVPETLIVLGLSLGASAIWALLNLLDLLTRPTPLGDATVVINGTYIPDRPWLDLLYQLAHIGLTIMPVLLAFYLLRQIRPPADGPFATMGLRWANVPRDLVLGLGMAAGVGIPGLGLYALARLLGLNATISAGNLGPYWWAIPVYILLAAMNGLLEEIVMVGYLFTRWTQKGLGPWAVIVISSLIRGTYHLYQGFGGFIGNIIMGLIFGWIYTRTKRVLPLVIAHTVLDIASFVGYALLAPIWPWLH